MILRGRRPALAAAIALAAALLASCGRDAPPNGILLVTLDTTRADRLGCYGRRGAETPELDRLAKEAARFESAVASVPVTLPSHSTMMTGLYPYHHGVRYNMIHVLPDKVATLAERLHAAGFATGAVPSAAVVAAKFGLAQGFDSYPDEFPKATSVAEVGERPTAEAVDRGIAWWRAHPKTKRFLWVHLYAPHYPYTPPFPYSSRFADRPYEGEIASMDHELGRLLGALRADGDWNETLVVVAGDHGEGLYEHGERWHSEQVYETTLHVPLLIKPSGRAAARTIAEPVGLVDLTPTILDYAGIAHADAMDGISLREAIATGRAPARAIYFESTTGAINYGWSPLHGIRSGSMKYFEGQRPEVYDLAADGSEARNLAGSDTRVSQSDLKEQLETYLRQEAASGMAASAAPPMDDEAMKKLISLGYVAAPAAGEIKTGGTHPPDMVDLEQEILKSQWAIAGKRWDEAADTLDYVLRRDPKNRFALFFRARTFDAMKDHERAVKTAEVLLALSPEMSSSVDLLGEMLSNAGRPREAADRFAAALAKPPGDPLLRYHRVLVLVDAHDLAEARAELARLEGQRPDHYSTSVARAIVEAAGGRASEALAALEKAAAEGLKSLAPVEKSPYFASVRSLPGYRALAARIGTASYVSDVVKGGG